MLNFFDGLLAPEWRKIIWPPNIADSVLKSLRVFCSYIAAVTRLSLSDCSTRPYYRVFEIDAKDVIYTNESYTFKTDVGNIDAFGVCLSKKTAIIGRDYTYNNGIYKFKRHPSTFGTTSTKGDQTVITFICLGGDPVDTLSPLGVRFFNATGDVERDAIETACDTGTPLGITQDLITATFGCKFSNSPIYATWVEGDTKFAITEDNELIFAPAALDSVIFTIGKKADYTALLSPTEYFAAKLVNGTFVFSLGLNTLSAIPDLDKNYPGLTIIDSTKFFGAELLSILRSQGCVFWNVPYIKNGINQNALSNYAVNPGKVNINGIVVLNKEDATSLRQPPEPTGSYTCTTTDMIIYNCM